MVRSEEHNMHCFILITWFSYLFPSFILHRCLLFAFYNFMFQSPVSPGFEAWPISGHVEERILEGEGDAQLLGRDTVCGDAHLAEAHAGRRDGRAAPLGEAASRRRPQPQSRGQRGLA